MAMDGFRHEYRKAKMHYNSYFSRQLEAHHYDQQCEDQFIMCTEVRREFRNDFGDMLRPEYRRLGLSKTFLLLEHLLAVMIYCNFTHLSSRFSETYRFIDEKE
eukprot:160839_1